MTRSKKHKFLSSEQLEKAVDEIADIAEDEQAQIAIIGGHALQIYGSDRFTVDIDIAAYAELEDLPPTKSLSFGGYQSSTPDGTPVDVVIRSDAYAPLYEAAIADALIVEDVPIPVVSPEYLAAMKMQANRDKDEVDLKWLITSGELDEKKAKKIIGKYLGLFACEEFDRIVDEARWKASKGR